MSEERIPPESQEAIGRRLRETREALELSPRQFYEAVGFSKTQLENYEAGRRLMKPAMAIRVITAFTAAKLDFNWLYHGDLGGTAYDFAQAVLSRRERDRAANEAA
ncbi:helix-turn-helix domain-containing protein [Methylobacterium sp. NFXW15]|uniref:helix-turn-helix domain-containing protein n=1 Tax=Methylobacterium sp. NFXW15 TaxID=2819512 RepID=UPI003CF22658